MGLNLRIRIQLQVDAGKKQWRKRGRKEEITYAKGLSLDLNLKERKLERLEHNEQKKIL